DAIDPDVIGLCLDTGHFRFGGADPVRAAHDYRSLIRHVHVKDVEPVVREAIRTEGIGLEEALARGVFCPLGQGDVAFGAVLDELRSTAYDGWLVIEQDQFLRASDTPASVVAGQRANREFLREMGL